jgi:hypothetical protein
MLIKNSLFLTAGADPRRNKEIIALKKGKSNIKNKRRKER